jgi:diketogulonate reductase-like aldo/keto reductase
MAAHWAVVMLVTSLAAAARAPMPTLPLQTPQGEIQMPVVGLGSAFGFTPPGSTVVAYNATKLWLQNGGRNVHSAWMYCNQVDVGKAVNDFMAESGVARKDIFIESMLPQWHLGYNATKANFMDTLKQLNMDYVDLFMFHWPGLFDNNLPMLPAKHVETCGIPVTTDPPCKKGERSWKKCRLESWTAMLELQAAGKIRALGTSNFEVPQLQQLLDATPESAGQALAVNQVESHLGYHDDYLQDWCVKHKVQQQAYSPLGGGQLPKRYDHALCCHLLFHLYPVTCSTNPAVMAAAKKHNKSMAQVSLRYLVQQGLSIIPKVQPIRTAVL